MHKGRLKMEWNTHNWERYSRHIRLPGFGTEGQEKLNKAKVLVVGCGGLGAPILQYLAAAGVGTIGVIDFDTVELSNLQRQTLFSEGDIGRGKTTVAIEKLKPLNTAIHWLEFEAYLDASNAMELFKAFDVIIDGTDNLPTRYLINDACVLLGKPFVYGSIYQFEGQLSIFNCADGQGGRGPNYRDLFPTPPSPSLLPNCAEGGVLGVLPGIIGSLQALETIKWITGLGDLCAGKLLVFDALSLSSRLIRISKDPKNPISGLSPSITTLIDYEVFCGSAGHEAPQSITPKTLQEWMSSGKPFQLLDVREEKERYISHIGGVNIPLSKLKENKHQISLDQVTIVYCRSGKRSAEAISLLSGEPGTEQLYNLEGGLQAWKNTVDASFIVP